MDLSKTEQIFFGRNPLREALKARVKIDEIFYESESAQAFILSLKELKTNSIKLSAELPGSVKKYSHQGVAFRCRHPFYFSLEALALQKMGFVIVCNELEDIHNFGSIARCAAGFGAQVIIHESKQSAELTPAAVKSSAGLAFHLKFCKVPKLETALSTLATNGFHLIGLDAGPQSQTLQEWSPQFPLALILGSESEGLSPSTRKRCESLVRIPTEKILESLNVSHAAAIAMAWAYQAR
jgi:23S rRNA (guanosine2251-2'-O)-methyltransferase